MLKKFRQVVKLLLDSHEQNAPSQSSDVATGRAEEQVDDVEALGLELVPSGVGLVGDVPDVVVAVEVELLDQLLAELNASAAVTQRIQGRRPRADAHHVGNDHQQSSAHAGLCW